jgi:hypothetical protein
MIVGEKDIKWDFGWEYATEILQAIHLLATTNLQRVDGEHFKAYWAGETLRIDIPREATL